MAKRRESAETEADTKRVKQVKKAGSSGPSKTRATSKDAGNDITEKEEKLERKVKPKSRSSAKRAGGNTSSTTAASTIAVKTSKYFQSPVKKEETDSEDDFDMVTSAAPVITVNAQKPEKEEEEDEDSEEDEDDWEEVEELAEPLGPVEPPEPALPSQPVEIEIETPEIRKRKKKQAELETYLRRMVNRYKKDVLIDTHKVHLMCLIASGMFRNRLCSKPDLLAITLSLLPSNFCMIDKERIDQNYLSELLKWCVAAFTLNPCLPCEERPDPQTLLERRLTSLSAKNHQEMTHVGSLATRKSHKAKETSKATSLEPKVSPGTKRPAGGCTAKGARGGKKPKKKEIREEDEEEDEKTLTSAGQRPKNSKRRSVASKVRYKEESTSEQEEDLSDDEEFQVASEEDSEDSEGEAKSTKRKVVKEGEETTNNITERRSGKNKDGPGADEWLEVYLEKTSSWVCVDVEQGVGVPHLCYKNATVPVTYVVSVDGDGFVKDLGKKYDPTWMTSSRKRRVDEDWWEETLEPFLGPEDDRDLKEDKELQNKLLNKPMPVSIAEYKNHPLYALKRHLLKYEAIYPETATVLGYCRGEPVYSRDCVHTLHSRDTWLKEARTVRLGEEPYKMVKGFSNRSRKARMVSEMKDENDLALFGEWQTEEYQPPIAVDGKVPRNDYGNVYLFKPCMLPVGCVHLRLPNLHRVARKLDLDAAPAVTGFDFHGGYSHAVTDGYIVCEEHEEVLRAAWVEEQELQKQKEKEKREKRAISNWTLLVKGLLIRERLKQRYSKKNHGVGNLACDEDTGGLSSDEEVVEGECSGSKTASETLAMSWPQNRQAEEDGGSASGLKKKTTTKREKKGQEKHLFPFEKV
uniref:Xeroderma pigmentosum, complementation group C n=1 Tax=Anabas testudineus TaxID=64144 RepID=A0A7N6BPV9_ANATE